MAKMSKAQRTAILDFHNGVTSKGHTLIAESRTIAALVRSGWATFGPGVSTAWALRAKRRFAYVTRAGLIAAGVDMDAIHAYASVANAGRTIHIGTFRDSCAQHGCPGCPPANAKDARGGA